MKPGNVNETGIYESVHFTTSKAYNEIANSILEQAILANFLLDSTFN